MMGVTALQLKRITALFLAALTAVLLLGACGTKGADSSQISSGRKESSQAILDNSGFSSRQADESASAAASSINHSQSNTSHQGSNSQQHSSSGSAQQTPSAASNVTSSEKPAAEVIQPVLTENAKSLGITQEMLNRAMVSAGNQVRIANALRKAKRGAPVTIGVIGGSISQGAVASAESKRYVNLVAKWWEDTFPNSEITLVNAAIGSTDSVIGVHRLEQDLLQYDPDFVIVEFAANDSVGDQWDMAYEAVLRRTLQSKNQPGILMMFMMYSDGKTQQKSEIPLGRRYGIPMVSYHDAIMSEVQSGAIKWSDLSPDIVHPNDRGMAIAAELITAYLASVNRRLNDIGYKAPALPDGYTEDYFAQFDNAKLLHSGNFQPTALGSFKKDFGVLKPHYPLLEDAWTSTGGTSPLVFENVEGSQIYLLYRKSNEANAGEMKVTIDGTVVKTINTKYDGGVFAPYEALVLDSESKKHRVEISLSSGSGTKVSILGLMVSSGA